MTSRISINIHGQNIANRGRLFSFLYALKPAYVLVLDEPGLAKDIKDKLPETEVIFRFNGDGGDGDIHNKIMPPQWLDKMAGKVGGDQRIILHTTNEPGLSRRLIAWHEELIKLANERGYRLCVLNAATGNPEPDQWDIARPMLELLATHRQHLLGLHEYAGGVITSGLIGGDPKMIAPGEWPASVPFTRWHCGRGQFLYEYCDKAKLARPRIVLTEHGFDDTSDIKPWLDTLQKTPPYPNIRGWRSLATQWRAWWPMWSAEQAYFEQLKWANEALYKGTAVEAQLLFCYGNAGGWEQFDIADAAQLQDMLVKYAQEQAQEKPPVFPLPDEFKLSTENLSGENYRLRLVDKVDDTPQLGWIKAGEKFWYIDRPGESFIFGKNFSGIIGYVSRDVLSVAPKPEPVPPPAPPPLSKVAIQEQITAINASITTLAKYRAKVDERVMEIEEELSAERHLSNALQDSIELQKLNLEWLKDLLDVAALAA